MANGKYLHEIKNIFDKLKDQDDLPNYYLRADLSIDCDSSRYRQGVAITSIMIFVYPIGIPLIYFYILYKRREKIMKRNEVGAKEVSGPYDFLFKFYKPKYWYFELIETGRRLTLTAILSVTLPGSSSQIVLAMVI